MYQILPIVAAASLALPKPNLPLEIWISILRLLDPASLLTAIKTNNLWKQISLADPVLKKTVRDYLLKQKQRMREELMNPGLLVSVQRPEPGNIFGRSNGTKIVRQRAPTRVNEIAKEVFAKKSKGASKKRKTERKVPYKSIRC